MRAANVAGLRHRWCAHCVDNKTHLAVHIRTLVLCSAPPQSAKFLPINPWMQSTSGVMNGAQAGEPKQQGDFLAPRSRSRSLQGKPPSVLCTLIKLCRYVATSGQKGQRWNPTSCICEVRSTNGSRFQALTPSRLCGAQPGARLSAVRNRGPVSTEPLVAVRTACLSERSLIRESNMSEHLHILFFYPYLEPLSWSF